MMSLSNQLQYQLGMQQLSALGAGGSGYHGDRYESIEAALTRKRIEAEKSLAARQQELTDIMAAISVVTDHPHVAKLINVLRKVGL